MDWLLDLFSSDEMDGVMRHVLSSAGGGLIAQGVLNTNQWTLISGGVMAGLSVLLSIANKKYMRGAKA